MCEDMCGTGVETGAVTGVETGAETGVETGAETGAEITDTNTCTPRHMASVEISGARMSHQAEHLFSWSRWKRCAAESAASACSDEPLHKAVTNALNSMLSKHVFKTCCQICCQTCCQICRRRHTPLPGSVTGRSVSSVASGHRLAAVRTGRGIGGRGFRRWSVAAQGRHADTTSQGACTRSHPRAWPPCTTPESAACWLLLSLQ